MNILKILSAAHDKGIQTELKRQQDKASEDKQTLEAIWEYLNTELVSFVEYGTSSYASFGTCVYSYRKGKEKQVNLLREMMTKIKEQIQKLEDDYGLKRNSLY